MLEVAGAPSLRNVDTFCLFVGYGRSGHSAIGSIIDAHPNAVVAHELHAVQRYFEGVSRDAMFREILEMSQYQARHGRVSSKAEGGVYPQAIDGQLKDAGSVIKVIDDKKGAGTTRLFARKGLDHIDRFKDYVGLPVKIIHVMRNPFDIVAAGIARGGSGFSSLVPLVAAIRARQLGSDWLDVYHEDVVTDPVQQIERIVRFLGLPSDSAHLRSCASYLFAEPRRRRFEMTWSSEAKLEVQRIIDRFDFLGRYSWES